MTFHIELWIFGALIVGLAAGTFFGYAFGHAAREGVNTAMFSQINHRLGLLWHALDRANALETRMDDPRTIEEDRYGFITSTNPDTDR